MRTPHDAARVIAVGRDDALSMGMLSGFLLGVLQLVSAGGLRMLPCFFILFLRPCVLSRAIGTSAERGEAERPCLRPARGRCSLLFLGRGPLAIGSRYRICEVTASAVVACYVYLQLGAAAFCASDVPEASKSFSYHAPRPAC